MLKIPKELAQKIYEIYAVTLMKPVPFDKMFPGDDPVMVSDKIRGAYERGIMKPETQLFWIHNLNRSAADFKEPYDMGVLNALEVALLIFSEKDPVFEKKPVSKVADAATMATLKKGKKEQDATIRTLEKDLKEERALVKGLRAELKKKK